MPSPLVVYLTMRKWEAFDDFTAAGFGAADLQERFVNWVYSAQASVDGDGDEAAGSRRPNRRGGGSQTRVGGQQVDHVVDGGAAA